MDVSARRDSAEAYLKLGYDPIPLKFDSKRPLQKGWQIQLPEDMWRSAPIDANLGLRGGGESKAAFIDCDEKKVPGTFANAQMWLEGLGFHSGDYPVVKTASGVGRHIYMTLEDFIPGNSRILTPGFGAGEFRYGPGAYVVAPPSAVTGQDYVFVNGDYRCLPKLAISDVLPIIGSRDEHEISQPSPTRISRRAKQLLRGKTDTSFPSRSEAEMSLLVSLINSGHTFDSIINLFLQHPCAGKFAELRRTSESSAIRYLQHSYMNAKTWADNHESTGRQIAKVAIAWAESIPWIGRNGLNNRAVFLAHCQIAYKSGKVKYGASSRELGEMSGMSHAAAARATARLIEQGLIVIELYSTGEYSSVYRLSAKLIHSLKVRV